MIIPTIAPCEHRGRIGPRSTSVSSLGVCLDTSLLWYCLLLLLRNCTYFDDGIRVAAVVRGAFISSCLLLSLMFSALFRPVRKILALIKASASSKKSN